MFYFVKRLLKDAEMVFGVTETLADVKMRVTVSFVSG